MKDFRKVLSALRVDGKKKVRLGKFATGSSDGMDGKKTARAALDDTTRALAELQGKLYAEAKTAVLVVFQALDTGGKDGVIRKVFGPINPQGVRVTSFKRPTDRELAHDYLWRIHQAAPARGMIGIFNRSHYEDVLVHRVHKLIPAKVLDERYRQINAFERHLTENNTVIVKFFLHISRDEQKARLQSRLDNPDKRWKFEMGDLTERKFWDNYQEAYQVILDKCSTREAPWYVIPSDRKWYRDWAVSTILRAVLEKINPKYPQEIVGLDNVVID
ncbi:MAG: polyphosphate kinase 2 family protein [Planctomycetes bacterium]|nr:polyphosphate kinase 2 family protein [Planctomycetota bacterium]